MTDPDWMLTRKALWSLDYSHRYDPQGDDPVPSCAHCPDPIDGDWLRLDRGMVLGAGTPSPHRVERDVDLHHGCYVPWMEAHHPRFVDTRVVA